MTITFKIPRGDLAKAEHLAALPNLTILDQRIEPSEDKIIVTAEVSRPIAPSAREGGGRPLLVGLVYELGGGREIDLGTWDLSNSDRKLLFEILEKSEKEFRRLLAELEAVGQADDSHEHA
jgi:hypothetical protein